MKYIKPIGLLLFLTGFTLFNFSFFWASYTLTPEIIKEKITDPRKAELFSQSANGLINKNTSSNFTFVSELTKIFETVNESQLTNFAINAQELDQLVAINDKKFSLASADSVFKGDDEGAVFKAKAFKQGM